MITELNIKTITALVAVLGLIAGMIQFIQVQKTEAARPYLEKKLAWCEEVVELTSFIAASKTQPEEKVQRFWQMYWGVMGLVEKKELTSAMIAFGEGLESQANLGRKSLAIAHACRKELTSEWSAKWSK